ncbi:Fasciclin arabinogalactan protein 19 [Spatholobus suberectus]|nr:Fasciclin arabinogalactan protein 19 [Spatholobus suberectus]
MTSRLGAVWVAFTVAALLGNAVRVRCVPSRELDSMLDAVRARGYDLFCNAIVTSDLQIELLSHQSDANHSFTFFAPTDASLFALDMTQTASSYTDTLRFHVVPRRLSLAQLRLLPDGHTLPTLLPQRRLQLTRRTPSAAVAVGGVDVAFPGLFYGRNVAVHGLAGILSLRSNNSPSPSPAPVVPPIRSVDRRFFSPRSSHNSPANQPVLAPVPKLDSFNVTNRPADSPIDAAPEGEPDWTVYPPAPRYPDSAISLPPEGYSEAAAPAPEVLDGIRKCVNQDVGLEESIMQCYAT